ncbi:FAD-linked oxidoreductase orf1 [Cladobotryum mycophilum]|uniref:FAD-linked oxidoreductase orf1 n=1 Tax=Cladobotryum mycophilum TaxID=491253 RepID=A0ABR0SNX0_9HYPO
MFALTAPGKTADQGCSMMSPYLARLKQLGIPYEFTPKQSKTYYDHYNAINGPLPYGDAARAQKLSNATPDGGAYLNEADPLVYGENTKKWQQNFYGTTYPKLRQIEDKWDVSSIFYAYTAVGSEDWTQDADGRLCKA